MAVGLESVSSAPSSASGVTSHTHNNLSIGSSTHMALFALLCLSGDDTANPTATWDSGGTNQSMELKVWTAIGTVNAYIFCVVAPTTGNNPLAFTWTGSRNVHAAAINFLDVNQSAPASGTNSGLGNGTSASVSLNAGDDDANLACFAATTAIDSVNAFEVFRTFTSLGGAGNWQPGNIGGMQATLNSAGDWVAVGLVVEVFTAEEEVTVTGSLTTNTTFTAILRRTQFVSN